MATEPGKSAAMRDCSIGSATGRWVLAATLLASGASFIMWSAITVALPTIQDHFSTNIAGIQWVVNSHLLTLSAFLLIGGSLGDHFGRKKIFMAGAILFATGAALSGFAWSIGTLISFQAIQGLGSALMVPQALAIINACFREQERGRAIGIWAGVSGGIAALGPWVGGWLVESFSWQAVFWMTLPVIALCLVVTFRFVPENYDPEAGRLDWPGTVLILLALVGIAYGLIGGPVNGWSTPQVLISLIGGVAAGVVFLLIEMRTREPLIPLKIFRSPLVSGANGVTLLLYFSFNGMIIFTVLNLQQVQGFSPIQAGLGLLPPIVIITFLAAPAGALTDRFGPRPQMIGGPLLVALGIALFMLGGTEANYFKHFLPGLIVVGMGMGLVIAPLTKSALSVETRYSGAASGVSNAVARTAGLLAVAVVGVIMLSTFTPNLRDIITSSSLAMGEQLQIINQYDKLGGIIIPDSFSETARIIAENAVKESFIFSYRRAMGTCAGLALMGSIISLFAMRQRPAPEVEELKCGDVVKERCGVV